MTGCFFFVEFSSNYLFFTIWKITSKIIKKLSSFFLLLWYFFVAVGLPLLYFQKKKSKIFVLIIWVYKGWLCIFACSFLFILKYKASYNNNLKPVYLCISNKKRLAGSLVNEKNISKPCWLVCKIKQVTSIMYGYSFYSDNGFLLRVFTKGFY